MPDEGRGTHPLLTTETASRELSSGAVHKYHLRLAPGEFVRVQTDLVTLLATAVLLGPDVAPTPVVEVDPSLERLLFVSRAGGLYTLEVRSTRKSAPTVRYGVRLIDKRPLSDMDRLRLRAQELFTGASRQQRGSSAPQGERSRAALDEALRLWRVTGDVFEQVQTHRALARWHDVRGDYPAALKHARTAARLWEHVDDSRRRAEVLGLVASMLGALGEGQEALAVWEQALFLAERSGDPFQHSQSLNDLGYLYDGLGDKGKALSFFQRAYERVHGLGVPEAEATPLNNIGAVYLGLAAFERATTYLELAMRAWRSAGQDRGLARTLGHLGSVAFLQGEVDSALRHHKAALQLARRTGWREAEVASLQKIGWLFSRQGRHDLAREYFARALTRGKNLSPWVRGRVLRDVGEAELAAGDVASALRVLQEAAELCQGADLDCHAAALRGLARAERHRGWLGAARHHLEQALASVERLRLNLTDQALRMSYVSRVRSLHELYVDVLMRLHEGAPRSGLDARALHASEGGRARGLLEMLAAARVDVSHHADQALLRQARAVRRKINTVARRRARGDVPSEDALKHLLVRDAELQARLRAGSPRFATLADPQPLSLEDIRTLVLDADTLLLEYALGDEASTVWVASQQRLQSARLPARERIEQEVRRLRDVLHERANPPPPTSPEEHRRRLRRLAERYQTAAATLGEMLIQPVADHLTKKRVLIVPDGALQYVPFATLTLAEPAGQARTALLAEHEVVMAASASVVAVLRQLRGGRSQGRGAVAIFADPVFSPDDARLQHGGAAPAHGTPVATVVRDPLVGPSTRSGPLHRIPFTRLEARAILATPAPAGSQLFLDLVASRQTLAGLDGSRFGVVHLATHAVLDDRFPELSGVVLSLVDAAGRPQDGFLRLHDIYNLDLPVDLVVLSACETALGRDVSGEGLVGLTRGFLYAGAASVLATLWKVDDRAAAELMRLFYKYLFGPDAPPPGAALRRAQLELRSNPRFSHPYHWGAFVLHGDWR